MIALAGVAQFLFVGSGWTNVSNAFRVYAGWMDWHELPGWTQFDLEAVLPNLLGGALYTPGLTDQEAVWRFQVLSVAVFALVAMIVTALGRLSPLDCAFIVVLGGAAKVYLTWGGKPDLLLMAMLLLCVVFHRSRWSIVPGVAAALCHPTAAVISLCAVGATQFALNEPARLTKQVPPTLAEVIRRIPPLWPLAGGAGGAAASLTLLHLRFPGYLSRGDWAKGVTTGATLTILPNLGMFVVLTLAAFIPFSHAIPKVPSYPLRSVATLQRVAFATMAVVVFYVAMFKALDHSRIVSILLFGPIVVMVQRYGRDLARATFERPAVMGLLLAVVLAAPPLAGDTFVSFRYEPFSKWLAALAEKNT